MKDREIKNHRKEFIRNLKKKGLKESTIYQKENSLKKFEKYLEERKIFLDKEIKKRNITFFKKSLEKEEKSKALKEKIISDSLQFIDYLSKKKALSFQMEKDEENDIQKIINYYFQTKGYTLEEIKEDAKKRKIIYSRHTRPAKDLLELAGSVERAKKAMEKVAKWATSRNLDYAIETVLKKWPEIDKLKPKEKEKKPFYKGEPMIKYKEKWYVIDKDGEWFEFGGKEEEINWKYED